MDIFFSVAHRNLEQAVDRLRAVKNRKADPATLEKARYLLLAVDGYRASFRTAPSLRIAQSRIGGCVSMILDAVVRTDGSGGERAELENQMYLYTYLVDRVVACQSNGKKKKKLEQQVIDAIKVLAIHERRCQLAAASRPIRLLDSSEIGISDGRLSIEAVVDSAIDEIKEAVSDKLNLYHSDDRMTSAMETGLTVAPVIELFDLIAIISEQHAGDMAVQMEVQQIYQHLDQWAATLSKR